jgi:hypothetical protein
VITKGPRAVNHYIVSMENHEGRVDVRDVWAVSPNEAMKQAQSDDPNCSVVGVSEDNCLVGDKPFFTISRRRR